MRRPAALAPVTGRLAVSLAALGVMFALAGLALLIAAGAKQDLVNVQRMVSTGVFGVLGAVVATRHPRNPIGWIFCAVAVTTGLGFLSLGYTELWLAEGTGPRWLGETAAVYHNASWVPDVLLPVTFLLLLFPDGRLLGPRWRIVGWCAVVGVAGELAVQLTHPGPVEDFPQVENPYAVSEGLSDALALSFVPLLVGILGSASSLVLRFRRAAPDQRLQIKWLSLAGAIAAVTLIVCLLLYDVLGDDVANGAILLSVLALPVAAAIAILRYRLYDIDVVINRTLVYGALTATLAVAYLAAVLLLQLALSPLTEQSGLAIAGSTLLVAALFRPARARIQAAVDRRFYRRRYDARRTLEGFGARLRDQVDLDSLGDELRVVVTQTMQPAHVSLWLRRSRNASRTPAA
jgi:hypothetical protein